MLHHLSLGARNIENAVRFYDAVLAPLGYVRVWSDLRPGEEGQAVGYGLEGSDDELAIKQVGVLIPHVPGLHVAFSATKRSAIITFHQAALATGGRDNERGIDRPASWNRARAAAERGGRRHI